MKKTLKTIKNIFVGIFLVAYFTVIILVSSLLLSRNDYGVTQFGDKVFIKITKEIANDKYKEGSLVILEAKEIKYLEIGEEVFFTRKYTFCFSTFCWWCYAFIYYYSYIWTSFKYFFSYFFHIS